MHFLFSPLRSTAHSTPGGKDRMSSTSFFWKSWKKNWCTGLTHCLLSAAPPPRSVPAFWHCIVSGKGRVKQPLLLCFRCAQGSTDLITVQSQNQAGVHHNWEISAAAAARMECRHRLGLIWVLVVWQAESCSLTHGGMAEMETWLPESGSRSYTEETLLEFFGWAVHLSSPFTSSLHNRNTLFGWNFLDFLSLRQTPGMQNFGPNSWKLAKSKERETVML